MIFIYILCRLLRTYDRYTYLRHALSKASRQKRLPSARLSLLIGKIFYTYLQALPLPWINVRTGVVGNSE